MEEIWAEVYGFDHLYEISNLGRLRTKFAGKRGYTKEYRIIEPLNNGKGYLRFNLRLNGKQKTAYVHRLVAEAFISNPNGYKEINHKDENKANNCSDNLEWCNHLYNQNYGTLGERVGTIRKKKIRCIESGIIYDSLTEASKAMSVCSTAINNCLKKRSKTCCGYTWEYVDV